MTFKTDFIMKRELLLLIFLIPLAIVCFGSRLAFAQNAEGLNLTIQPSILELSYTPGKEIRQIIRVYNNGTKPLRLKVTVNKLTTSETGEIVPTSKANNDETINWFTFQTRSFDALPSEWTDIPFSLSIPQDAAFGHYFAITISQDVTVSQKNGESVIGQIVLPVFINMAKKVTVMEGKLITFTATSAINQYVPVLFHTTIAST